MTNAGYAIDTVAKALDGKKVRRRPGEPQKEQKEATRKRLLEAAFTVFARNSYHTTSIEMIADEANVSRTTFYRHFDGKLSIALALFDSLGPELQKQWKDVLDAGALSLQEVEAWVTRHVETVEGNRTLITVLNQVEALETDLQPYVLRYEEDILSAMWPDGALNLNEHKDEIRASSLLLLLQVEKFLNLFTIRDWGLDRGALIRSMAHILYDFLQFRAGALAQAAKARTKQRSGGRPA